MSKHYITVITIHKEPHPNADRLFLQKVDENNFLVLNSNDWKEGQLAIHIEPDYEVDTNHKAFAWLASQCRTGENWYRTGIRTIRGVDSFGLAVPFEAVLENLPITTTPTMILLESEEGKKLPIRRWENPRQETGGETLPRPAKLQTGKYDIESYIKFADKWFKQGEDVVVTQKLHGSNGSWAFFDDQFWACSRHEVKKESELSIWWKTLRKTPELQTFLKENQDMVAFGEVYGMNPQHRYGCNELRKELRLALFDIKQRTANGWRWLNHAENMELKEKYNLPWVPVLGIFKYDTEEMKKLSCGPSLMPKPENDVMEGIVVKPVVERVSDYVDRVIVKFVSPTYLSIKET